MDDWDTVTKIGSKTRGGGGSAHETVVRGKSALNAAQRSGAVIGTEKKFGGTNAGASGTEGQRLTKIDRSDDIIKPASIDKNIKQIIQDARKSFTPTMTQTDLAKKCNLDPKIVQNMENLVGPPDQAALAKMEKVLGVKLRGKDLGGPLHGPKKK